LWEERIPDNMISLMAGRPGGGKSLATTHIAAKVSEDADVILSSPENVFHEMVRPRLEAIGADLERVHLVRGWRFPEDLGELEAAIIEYRARLVVLDPISGHLGFHRGRRVSRFDDSIRSVSGPLEELAELHRCGVLMTDHVIKAVSPRAHVLHAIAGSGSGLVAAAQMVFLVGRDPAEVDRLVLVAAKSNLRDDPGPYAFRRDSVSYVGEDGRTATAGTLAPLGEVQFPDPINLLLHPREEKPGPAPDKLAAASEWLTRYLYAAEGHERPAQEVEEDARTKGITRGTLTRAKKTLKVESVQRKREWWWRLPQGLVDGLDAEQEQADE
jgi:hypothetical protein